MQYRLCFSTFFYLKRIIVSVLSQMFLLQLLMNKKRCTWDNSTDNLALEKSDDNTIMFTLCILPEKSNWDHLSKVWDMVETSFETLKKYSVSSNWTFFLEKSRKRNYNLINVWERQLRERCNSLCFSAFFHLKRIVVSVLSQIIWSRRNLMRIVWFLKMFTLVLCQKRQTEIIWGHFETALRHLLKL